MNSILRPSITDTMHLLWVSTGARSISSSQFESAPARLRRREPEIQGLVSTSIPPALKDSNVKLTTALDDSQSKILKPDMQSPSVFPKRRPLGEASAVNVEAKGDRAHYIDGASEPYN